MSVCNQSLDVPQDEVLLEEGHELAEGLQLYDGADEFQDVHVDDVRGLVQAAQKVGDGVEAKGDGGKLVDFDELNEL